MKILLKASAHAYSVKPWAKNLLADFIPMHKMKEIHCLFHGCNSSTMTTGMDWDTFKQSLKNRRSPEGLTGPLLALWWAAKGDWDKAHKIAQDIPGAEGSLVHAYLHRKEGDLSNAGYWYSRAGRPRSSLPLEKEWEEIVKDLLREKAY